MNLRVQSLFDLPCGSAEFNFAAPVGNVHNPHSVRLKPPGNSIDIRGGGTVTFAELLGCQPFVKVRRSWILLFGEKLFEFSLPLRITVQRQDHAVYRKICGDASVIPCLPDSWMCGLRQSHGTAV